MTRKRGQFPRVPSPIPTAFSSFSSYQIPIREPTLDYRRVSKTHFDDLSRYLTSYLAKQVSRPKSYINAPESAPPDSGSTARQKLTRLTVQQFHELSTDVYDELIRRQNENEVPFLLIREEFHPQRNQARQKLATLPTSRFDDLSSDVYYELARRYPEFKEETETVNLGSTELVKLTRLTIQQFHELSTDVHDELIRRQNEEEVFLPFREEFHPKRNQARQKLATLPTSRFDGLSSDVYYELARRYPEFKEETETVNLGSTELVKMPFARPWDVLDPIVYVETVKEILSRHLDDYTSFLSIISDWCQNDGSPVSMYNLIEKIFGLFSARPRLFRGFNALLRINSYRIECSLDKEEVDFFMVVASSGARIQATPDVPLPFVTNTAKLRSLSCSEWEKLTTLKSGWAKCVLELLQTELDDERFDPRHRKQCLRCFQQLVRNSNELPFSFVLHHIVREGRSPVRCGGFADIWKGQINGQLVCCKVLRIFNMDNGRRKLVQSFCNEALVWRQLSHPNVLPFYGVNEDLFSPSLCLVSPWMKNGHIMNYLEANPHHDRIVSISQIAAGLRYLHELNPRIVHGDIKGANVLVTDELTCCLADFGLSSVVETHTVNGTTTSGMNRGTVRWMAPELIDPDLFPNHDAHFKIPSDIYSFGCIMFEVFTGQPPFYEKKNDPAVINSVLKGIRPAHPPPEVDFPNEIWALVVSCWSHQPDSRPTANHINGILQRLSSTRAQASQVTTRNEPAPPWYDVQTPTSIEVWLHREEERLAQTRNPSPANNVTAPPAAGFP